MKYLLYNARWLVRLQTHALYKQSERWILKKKKKYLCNAIILSSKSSMRCTHFFRLLY